MPAPVLQSMAGYNRSCRILEPDSVRFLLGFSLMYVCDLC